MFLDLRADRYASLAPDESKTVRARLEAGAPGVRGVRPSGHVGPSRAVADEPSEGAAAPAAADEAVGSLLEAGLVTRDARHGRALAMPPPVPLASDLVGYPVGRAPAIGAAHAARFMVAASATAARLRWRSLVDVVARVRDRKARREREQPEAARLRELVEVYKRLRPLMFTAKEHCLYDSLVLVDFLAAHDVYPLWVVGVRMGPFAAHSWVQEADVVLNDAVANAARFTPILIV